MMTFVLSVSSSLSFLNVVKQLTCIFLKYNWINSGLVMLKVVLNLTIRKYHSSIVLRNLRAINQNSLLVQYVEITELQKQLISICNVVQLRFAAKTSTNVMFVSLISIRLLCSGQLYAQSSITTEQKVTDMNAQIIRRVASVTRGGKTNA